MIYDAAWFPRIKGNNANLSLRLRPTPSGALRRAFLAGDDQIRYTYPKLRDQAYHDRLRHLAALRRDLELDQYTHPVVISLYKEKIAEKQQYHELVRAAYHAQDETGSGAVAVQQFRHMTEALFGAPDRDIFNYIVKKVQEELAAATHMSGNPAFERLQERFHNPVFTAVPTFPGALVNPEQGTDEASDVALTTEAIRAYITDTLRAHDMEHWRVLVAVRGGRFSVLANQRIVTVPSDAALRARRPERQITQRKLRGLVAHEVLTHAKRAEAGLRSSLQLLGIGLPQYLVGEEGVAALREQIEIGADDYLNQDIYFAIGLAYGLDLVRQQPTSSLRPMREVFDILHDYLTVRYGVGDRSAMQGAFNLCRQIYITTPHITTPLVFTRPLIYLTGNIAVSGLVSQDQTVQRFFDVGKYDPTNESHCAALQELGICN